MVVMIGQATRLAQFIDRDEKEYVATIRFGFETDTGDKTGSPKSKVQSPKSISIAEVDGILPRFTGEIEQVPPMYSAKKIDGKKLYESARKGIEVERKPHRVTIRELRVDQASLTCDLELATCDMELTVVCTAGTYIRVLAEDIGRTIGVGAHLAELRRTRSGRFDLSQAITLDGLAAMDDPASALLPMEMAVEHLPVFVLRNDRLAKTRNGMSTRIGDAAFADGETVRMTTSEGELVAIGSYSVEDGSVKPQVVLV